MAGCKQWVVVGRIGAPYGIRGWMHLQSFTSPPENLFEYTEWRIDTGWGEQTLSPELTRKHGRGWVVKLPGCESREQAGRYRAAEICISRDALPEPAIDEFYWSDLEGLEVRSLDGKVLGVVDHLLATGANDVLVVRGDKEHLVPFVSPDYVKVVDLEVRFIEVDWDPAF